MARVLVVDDEPGWRIIVRHALESNGHHVEEAGHGAAALDLIRSGAPDLVVCDLRMPVMTGRELFERIRSEPSTAGIPVVMMSAQIPPEIPADAVLHKPFRPSHVLETVGRLLAGSVGSLRPIAEGEPDGGPRGRARVIERSDIGRATPSRRISGQMSTPTGAGVSDHACWGYSSGSERAWVAANWLADGVRIGQRGIYAGSGSAEDLRAELATVAHCAEALDAGSLFVVPFDEVFDIAASTENSSRLATCAQAIEDAIAAGFRGLRAAVDITPLVLEPGRRPAHLRWEQVADRYMTVHPWAAMCMYDTGTIDDLDSIVCAHSLQGPNRSPFALYGTGPTRAALEGEVSGVLGEVFADLLARLPVTDEIVDLSKLSFIDGRSAWILHDELQERRSRGQDIILSGAPPIVRDLWSSCGFDPAILTA